MKKNTFIANSIVVLVVLLTFSCSQKRSIAENAIENKYQLSTEKQLFDNLYNDQIEAFYYQGKEGFFTGKADVKIYYRIFENPNSERAILISSGRTEAAIKYKELIFDLFKNGYSVYIHDHRGQGLSGKMTENADMGYIDAFQFYVDDMKYFYDNFMKIKNYSKHFLLAHSMGGAIGMTYLEQHPADFEAASFSSPMLGLKKPICKLVKVLDSPKPKFAIGQSEYKDSKTGFAKNILTGSQIRYDRMIDGFDDLPTARLGGATYTWINKSCQQFDYMNNSIGQIQTPFILFSAKNEQIVHTAAHFKFVAEAQKLGKKAKLYEISNAQHELLIEKDQQRLETLVTTLDFFGGF